MAGPSPIVRYGRYGAAAFEFSGTIAAGSLVGWLADRWLGSEPYALVASTLVAVVGGFVRLVTMLQRFDRLDRAREP